MSASALRLVALVTVLGLGLLAPPARAEPAAYAVIAIEVSGDAEPTLRGQVGGALERGVAEAGGRLVSYEAVTRRLASEPALIGCLSTRCVERIAALTSASRLLRARVDTAGANFQATVELIDGAGVQGRRDTTCTVCTVAEFTDGLAAAVASLLGAPGAADAPAPAAPQAQVVIDTDPAGGVVTIAGRDGAWPAPWSGALAPGAHRVTGELAGRRATREIEVAAEAGEQRFTLALPPPGPGARARRAPAWVRWSAIGASAALVVGGLVWLSADGDGTCGVDERRCPQAYETTVPGLATTLLGVVGGGVSGLLVWRGTL